MSYLALIGVILLLIIIIIIIYYSTTTTTTEAPEVDNYNDEVPNYDIVKNTNLTSSHIKSLILASNKSSIIVVIDSKYQ